MQFTTNISRDMRGDLVAKTTVPLEQTTEGQRVITLRTYKGYKAGTIISVASVTVDKIENGFRVSQFSPFDDYSKTVLVTPSKRVTEKSLEAAHNEALKLFPAHVEQAKLQYDILAA